MSVDILAERIRSALAGKKVTEQRMFGGICFMLNGNMAIAASPNGLLVRVGKEGDAAALRRPGTRPMIQRDRPMAGYLYVDETGTRTSRQLAAWVEIAMAHAATLPAKVRTKNPATSRNRTRRGPS